MLIPCGMPHENDAALDRQLATKAISLTLVAGP